MGSWELIILLCLLLFVFKIFHKKKIKEETSEDSLIIKISLTQPKNYKIRISLVQPVILMINKVEELLLYRSVKNLLDQNRFIKALKQHTLKNGWCVETQ